MPYDSTYINNYAHGHLNFTILMAFCTLAHWRKLESVTVLVLCVILLLWKWLAIIYVGKYLVKLGDEEMAAYIAILVALCHNGLIANLRIY